MVRNIKPAGLNLMRILQKCHIITRGVVFPTRRYITLRRIYYMRYCVYLVALYFGASIIIAPRGR